jgi:hypothetical protein
MLSLTIKFKHYLFNLYFVDRILYIVIIVKINIYKSKFSPMRYRDKHYHALTF